MASNTDEKVTAVRLHSNRYVSDKCDFNLAPVIFLHGLFSNSATWSNVKRKIADETRRVVYSLDLRNHGQSEYADDFSLEALTADLENFLIVNKFSKVVLVGHSIGGRVCIALTLRKPEMVEKLILEEASIGRPSDLFMKNFRNFFKLVTKSIPLLPSTMSEKEASDLVLRTWNMQMPKEIGEIAYNGVFLSLHKDANGKFRLLFNLEPLEKAINEENPFSFNLTPDQVFKGPCLVLYAPKSPLNALSDEGNIRLHFPNVKFHAMERGYHILHAECPEEYCEVVIFFIQGDY